LQADERTGAAGRWTVVRRSGLYGLCFVALVVAAVQLGLLLTQFANLAMGRVPRLYSAADIREAMAVTVLILTGSLVLWGLLWRWAERRAQRDVTERTSRIRLAYFYAVFALAGYQMGLLLYLYPATFALMEYFGDLETVVEVLPDFAEGALEPAVTRFYGNTLAALLRVPPALVLLWSHAWLARRERELGAESVRRRVIRRIVILGAGGLAVVAAVLTVAGYQLVGYGI
jgi:hypothetical protein